jgi:hypothetical protein
VVVAPAQQAPPPPAPSGTSILDNSLPNLRNPEQDSIFEPVEVDDLFGGPPAPRLEIPPLPSLEPPTLPPPLQDLPAPPLPQTVVLQPVERTVTYVQPEPAATAPPGLNFGAASDAPAEPPPVPDLANPFASGPATDLADAGMEEDALPRSAVQRESLRYRGGSGTPWFMLVVVVPLISYSVLVTILLAMAYLQPKPRHPLEMMQDVGNSNPPAQRGKGRVSFNVNWGDRATKPLPPKLLTRLGEPITLGDLNVTPKAVELRKVVIRTRGYAQPEPGRRESVVLYLDLENVSQDVWFCPLDPWFDRRHKTRAVQSHVPFTFLVLGKEGSGLEKRFYGGPCEWDKEGVRDSLEISPYPGAPNDRLFQDAEKELGPGEKMTSFVCTDSEDEEIAVRLAGYTGPLLYHVHLRRGLVAFRGEEVSTTGVIGVEFTSKDVRPIKE